MRNSLLGLNNSLQMVSRRVFFRRGTNRKSNGIFSGRPERPPGMTVASRRSRKGKGKERRRKERGDNRIGLLRLARKAHAATPEEALFIAVDGNEAREAWIRF